jgi:VanZ family protein
MGLIYLLSAQSDLPTPDTHWLRKLFSSSAHAFMYGVLAVLWLRVLGRGRWSGLVAFGLTMLYALSDELHQTFVPGRVADPWDLFCDALGAVVMLVAFGWLWRKREAFP